MKHLFITGLHRSGTTLLEKILLNHPQVFVASQPAPFIYYNAKSCFLSEKKLKRQYPLDTLFAEEEYNQNEWNSFLADFCLNRNFLSAAYNKMQSYEGQWTRELLLHWNELKEGTFINVYKQICELAQRISLPKEVVYTGSKEIMCEEYINYFLAQGLKVFCIVRDPRDMILSTNSGDQMGEIRPTLFYLRNWRKSIAFALNFQHHPDFFFIRYEDLVNDFNNQIDKITQFLGLPIYPRDIIHFKDQDGQSWQGNSSFGKLDKVSSAPIGRFQTMKEEAIRFIETFCYPEMKLLGYKAAFINDGNYSEKLLENIQEPFLIGRKDFPNDYSSNKINMDLEKLRILYLTNNKEINSSDIIKYFITEAAYLKLKW